MDWAYQNFNNVSLDLNDFACGTIVFCKKESASPIAANPTGDTKPVTKESAPTVLEPKNSADLLSCVFFEERCKLCMVKVGCSWILPQIVYLKSQPKLILGVKPSSLSTGSKQRIIETNSRSAGSVKKTFTLGSRPFVGPQTTRYMNFPASCRSGQIAGGPKEEHGQENMRFFQDHLGHILLISLLFLILLWVRSQTKKGCVFVGEPPIGSLFQQVPEKRFMNVAEVPATQWLIKFLRPCQLPWPKQVPGVAGVFPWNCWWKLNIERFSQKEEAQSLN